MDDNVVKLTVITYTSKAKKRDFKKRVVWELSLNLCSLPICKKVSKKHG